jgi:hypothetical protein
MKILALLFVLSGNQSLIPVQQSIMQCGIAPIPPIDCDVGNCECDENGENCHWTIICGRGSDDDNRD